jgi:hypothetical protein
VSHTEHWWRCSNIKLHDEEEANNTKRKRKCATVRPTHFHGGVPSLIMEKIPNHLGNEACANFETHYIKTQHQKAKGRDPMAGPKTR